MKFLPFLQVMKLSEDTTDLYLYYIRPWACLHQNIIRRFHPLYTNLLVYFVYSQSSLYCIALCFDNKTNNLNVNIFIYTLSKPIPLVSYGRFYWLV